MALGTYGTTLLDELNRLANGGTYRAPGEMVGEALAARQWAVRLSITTNLTDTVGVLNAIAGTTSSNRLDYNGVCNLIANTFQLPAAQALRTITGGTPPGTPTIGTATTSTPTTASVTFTAADALATSFVATSSPGSITGTAASSPITVSGLTTGTAYTFTVYASNASGNSAASAASNSVTPSVSYFGLFNVGTTLFKWDFSNDTVSTASVSLTNSNEYMASHSNVGTAGYTQSGTGGTTLFGTKVLYSPLTASAMANAPVGRNQPSGGAGNTGTAGYVVGATGSNTTSNKVLYSNDTQSTLTNLGGNTSQGGASASNVGSACCTQRTNSSSGALKMPYSTETFGAVSSFPATCNNASGVATNSGTAGYFYPGYLSAVDASVFKWLYSNDSKSTLASTATPARYGTTGLYVTGVAGYFLGGNNLAGSTNKMPFSTETFSTSTTVNTGVYRLTSVSNGG